MAKANLSIIIPAYNEAQRIVPTLLSIHEHLKRSKLRAEIVVVDDGSTDATQHAVTGLVDEYIKLPQNCGKGVAVRRGMLLASAPYILMMDADGSAPITALDNLWPLRKEADIIIGSRHIEGSVIHIHQSLLRQTVSYLANVCFRLILRLPYADTQCGFKLFKKEAARAIFTQTLIDHWGLDVEALKIAQVLGLTVNEVPIAWHDSRGGTLRAGRAAIYTFEEVISIWLNVRMGKYKRSKQGSKSK